MPKVSVLMPVYNAEQYLAQAIDSILKQTFTDWELILINDGSTDNSEAIITQYEDERIYYIRNASNSGLIKTLNKGIDFCHGKYIARMDADDVCEPSRLQKQVDFMELHADYVMCGTNATVIDNNGNETGKIENLSSDNYLKINLLFSTPFIHPSVMIRTEILRNNRYDENYLHVEDYELWCRLAQLGKVANIEDKLIRYRWHQTNVSVLNSTLQDELKGKVIQRELDIFLDLKPTKEELYYHTLTFNLYKLGNKADISTNEFDNISKWFSKIIAQNKRLKRYPESDLIAFLWSRWIVLSFSQKRYSKIIPNFASFNPQVIMKVLKLIFFLKSKK